MKKFRVVLTLTAVLAVSGCAGSASLSAPPVDSNSTTPTSAPSGGASSTPPTSPPTPLATSTPAPTSAVAVITTAGFGDLKLRRQVPATTSVVVWDANYCVDNGLEKPGSKYAGKWIAKSGADTMVVRTLANAKLGKITSFTFFDPALTTKSGAHVGTSVGDLKKLFSGIKATKGQVSDLYLVADDLGKVVFEVATNKEIPNYWKPSEVDKVQYIHVITPDQEAFSIAGGDVGFNCGA